MAVRWIGFNGRRGDVGAAPLAAVSVGRASGHGRFGGGLALAAAALGLAGCTSAQPAAPASSADGAVTPKVNRVVFATEPPGHENMELRNLSPADFMPLRPMYDALIGVDPTDGKNRPYLATSWSLRPDGVSFDFKLREGVQLHHEMGAFTGKDVVIAWKEVIKEDSLHGNSPFFRESVKDVEVVNDYDVVFHLTRPDGNFLSTMSEMSGGVEPFSKAQFDKTGPGTFQTGPIAGTGPYQFKEAEQGRYIRYERPAYKHYRMTPDFPEFEFRFVKEASTRLAGLLTGEVQLANLPEDLMKQASGQGMKVAQGKVPALRVFAGAMCCFIKDVKDYAKGYMNPDDPLADVRVRRALSKAINRDELNKAFFGGKGQLMVLNVFHPTRPGWNPEWEKRFQDEYGYDPAKAKALLAEAGYGPNNPLKTNALLLPVAGYSGGEDILEALAGYWRSAGIDVKLINIDATQQLLMRRQFLFSNTISLTGTASYMWTGNSAHGSSLGPRGNRAELPDADRLLAQVANTLDEKKQDDLWRQVGEVNFSQHKHIPLFWNPVEVMYNPVIVGDYIFGGYNSGAFTHVYNIKAAR